MGLDYIKKSGYKRRIEGEGLWAVWKTHVLPKALWCQLEEISPSWREIICQFNNKAALIDRYVLCTRCIRILPFHDADQMAILEGLRQNSAIHRKMQHGFKMTWGFLAQQRLAYTAKNWHKPEKNKKPGNLTGEKFDETLRMLNNARKSRAILFWSVFGENQ